MQPWAKPIVPRNIYHELYLFYSTNNGLRGFKITIKVLDIFRKTQKHFADKEESNREYMRVNFINKLTKKNLVVTFFKNVFFYMNKHNFTGIQAFPMLTIFHLSLSFSY